MSQIVIVVDDLSHWAPYYPSDQVITFEDYLKKDLKPNQRTRVINLCEDYGYLKQGYYCSLLAEARGHHVIPTIRFLNDVSSPSLYQINMGGLAPILEKLAKSQPEKTEISAKSYFGIVEEEWLKPIARILFERFPCPILSFNIRYTQRWEIVEIGAQSHVELTDEEQTSFANALDYFSRKIWREKKPKKTARYDIAILANPEEPFPPSTPSALNKFVAAGKALDVDVEIISPSDYMRIPEFDALFIRETTSIDHHTYRFAKKAESEGLVVIDDSNSILRCTNKVYLAKLFETHNIPTPKTHILHKGNSSQLLKAVEDLGLPLVLKIPDGSFSRGVDKVKTIEDLEKQAAALFEQSSLLLAQEFLYTDFDWRIGVLNNKPLFACRYYMVKNHWQIYRHSENKKTSSGGFDTLPTYEVPKAIIQAALKATKPIGNGLYGVDVKESKGKGYVIEVNDNPNVDSGVEDKYLGKELYVQIIQDLVSRIEAKRHG